MIGLLMLAASSWAQCPERLPDEYADDARSSGRVFLVVKDERFVGVYENDTLLPGACFTVQLGPAADDGPKAKKGDMRTPEGWYAVSHRNPDSQFYRSLAINYPNFDDVMYGIEHGVIDHATGNELAAAINAGRLPNQSTALGGDLFIHGNPNGWMNDWTWGCVAVQNRDMDVLYQLGDPGTPVLILPTLGENESADQ
ncbi:hypothetical protein A2348_04055 [Candidatus Uhrbacteria bacterium RIFOXYB12_FULL_58_10]|uniref:L,D-TPase catalytic domain-containing protein n=1 Tax=Candidatus Uhrbacteria bacterium RIFOXYB2_FULL_57_15 TaxID=1802422 RepID=A0A1F7W5I5_9BACT|nr:MAG: hypothetical protein A2348_04055 [Candidatus Uhrbacteria bacterium RIFOXYB12_FULL_58_10]OGL97906.1 MAG: hypothetical protein A2304_03195 [Candidatus Uhrbacteria bacterium RIFOXYB2_FULL_57_15]OGL99905.1 MAG: hypothetical protein A2501_05245 [Candidatus Uhrbacteria bacterium RIFOXYC12_FULL_57_11]